MLYGHLNQISLDLKKPLHLDWGEILPIDERFGQFDPAAHVSDDMFDGKIAFEVLLNFPSLHPGRKDRAGARAGAAWTGPTPAAATCSFPACRPAPNQNAAAAFSEAETYIAEYNIYMGQPARQPGENPVSRQA